MKDPGTEKSFGVYSEAEMKSLMGPMHKWKSAFLRPLMKLFAHLGFTPDGLSISGAVVAFLGFVLSFALDDAFYFFIGVWLHMLIDGFDGTLARFLGKVQLKGSFVDVVADHVVIILASIFIFYFSSADFLGVFLYTIFYTFLQFAAFILNYVERPYEALFRPRIYLYLGFSADLFFGTDSVNVILYTCALVMFLFVVQGVLRLKEAVSD